MAELVTEYGPKIGLLIIGGIIALNFKLIFAYFQSLGKKDDPLATPEPADHRRHCEDHDNCTGRIDKLDYCVTHIKVKQGRQAERTDQILAQLDEVKAQFEKGSGRFAALTDQVGSVGQDVQQIMIVFNERARAAGLDPFFDIKR